MKSLSFILIVAALMISSGQTPAESLKVAKIEPVESIRVDTTQLRIDKDNMKMNKADADYQKSVQKTTENIYEVKNSR